MFSLISAKHRELISKSINSIQQSSDFNISMSVKELIDIVYDDVPDTKRASYGRYTIAKRLGKEFFDIAYECSVDLPALSKYLFTDNDSDSFVRSFGVQLFVLFAIKTGEIEEALSFVAKAANDTDWIVRECTQGFIKQLTKKYPDELYEWYINLTTSKSANVRRFVVESLRPVTENKWMHKQPDYPLSIISKLYEESDPYPRSSVGNSLSDWFRVNEEITWPIVEELAKSTNEHSQWIAYRACRNIVKTYPERVMTMLNVREYKYKNRVYHL